MLILTMSMVHGGDDKSVKPVNNGGDYDDDDDIGVDDGVSEDGIRFSTMSPGLHQQLLSSPQVLPPTRTTTLSTGFMRSYLSSLVPQPTCCWTFSSQMGTLSILIRSDLYVIKILMSKYETKWRKIFCPGEWKRKPALIWICC